MTNQSKNKIKLTKRLVETASANATSRQSIWDTEIKGFNVRLYPTGRKVYYLQYRNKLNATKKVKIGVHGNISTEMAREKAQKLALEISSGMDPAAPISPQKHQPTMEDLCNEYISLHAKTNKRTKSVKNDLFMIQNTILPALGRQKLDEVTSHDFQKLHRSMKKTPYKANRVRSLLSKMFNLAIEWNWHTVNPALLIQKYQEHKRTRWLDDNELDKLWDALELYHNQSVATVLSRP